MYVCIVYISTRHGYPAASLPVSVIQYLSMAFQWCTTFSVRAGSDEVVDCCSDCHKQAKSRTNIQTNKQTSAGYVYFLHLRSALALLYTLLSTVCSISRWKYCIAHTACTVAVGYNRLTVSEWLSALTEDSRRSPVIRLLIGLVNGLSLTVFLIIQDSFVATL